MSVRSALALRWTGAPEARRSDAHRPKGGGRSAKTLNRLPVEGAI